MNRTKTHTAELVNEGLEMALMAVAHRVQLTPTQYEDCQRRYQSLARHVDRDGSPLEGKVLEVYPSGSQSIHAAILSHVKSAQHDLDAVLELEIPQDSDPEKVLSLLYKAIKGDSGSKYHEHRVVKNSRCVTVHYADGVTVDLMPVVRRPGGGERAAKLFHFKPASAGNVEQRYTKPVNPWGFSNCFNNSVTVSGTFEQRYQQYRDDAKSRLSLEEKAETQPMPEPVPLSQKSTRVVALQLIKRFRDKRFRRVDHQGRKTPPSVVFSEQVRRAGDQAETLDEELRNLSSHIMRELQQDEISGNLITVVNPVYTVDIFTDRWPACQLDQQQWIVDLQYLVNSLDELREELFDPEKWKRVFKDLFGETASNDALNSWYARQRKLADNEGLVVGANGHLRANGLKPKHAAVGAILPASSGAAIPRQTFDGGCLHDLKY